MMTRSTCAFTFLSLCRIQFQSHQNKMTNFCQKLYDHQIIFIAGYPTRINKNLIKYHPKDQQPLKSNPNRSSITKIYTSLDNLTHRNEIRIRQVNKIYIHTFNISNSLHQLFCHMNRMEQRIHILLFFIHLKTHLHF